MDEGRGKGQVHSPVVGARIIDHLTRKIGWIIYIYNIICIIYYIIFIIYIYNHIYIMVFKYVYIYLVSLSIYIYRYGSIYGPSINGWIISLYYYVIIWLNSLIIYYVIIIYIIELIHLTRKYG